MKDHRHHQSNSIAASLRHSWNWIKGSALMVGLASLIWLVFKSGPKPSRIQYPCQRAAATNVGLFILPFLLPLLHRTHRYLKTCTRRQVLSFIMATLLSTGMIFMTAHLWTRHQEAKQVAFYDQLRNEGPVGRKAVVAGGAAGFLTVPHAMAITSPHRVVSIHHAGATNWDFQCTRSDPCPAYYGDDRYVDQDIVDQMVDRGMQALTGAQTTELAWEAILPGYQAGEIVAIKVNFNDSIMGGGTSGYEDNDAYVDALPQVVNAVIAGLIGRGVAREHIRVFDSSRYITDRFRDLIDYPGVQYYDRHGNGDDVHASTFDSALATAVVDFTNSGYPAASSTHKISDVLVASDYLINMPIMKRHGGAGITLSLKNHLGSINGFVSGGHDMHDYFYLGRSHYDSDTNPIVDINANPHIADKTVLIIGDALYGGWRSNNTPPERWDRFGNDSPNMLFFAVDPVAVDSVMYDYLCWEGDFSRASEDILRVAANAGLGVHERWNDDDLKQYTTIDHVQIDLNDHQAPTVPTELAAEVISSAQVDLDWTASIDADTSVAGYHVYRDGAYVGSATTTGYADSGLSPETRYSYTVTAYDPTGNESAPCAAVTATTSEAPVVIPPGGNGQTNTSSGGSGGGGCFLYGLPSLPEP